MLQKGDIYQNNIYPEKQTPADRNRQEMKSVADMPELTKHKISKELAMGRIAGPFSVPPFPTLRVSPIGLVPKKNGVMSLSLNLFILSDKH
jgi:hypothetical protein